ncbi:MAG: hypothetical protein JKX85_05880 [Phycisphaeraceae bacterium]|nr:hypothetical protein [Phycisphaeraceae bacterium]
MQTFLKKLILFLAIPIIILFIVENYLPATLFTFRAWEALAVRKSKYFTGQFYPNTSCSMIEEGDLAPHTPLAVKKKVFWKIDEIGFRNDQYIPEPDVLIIGDSNTVGSGMSQEETLTARLKQLTNLKVYNIAPAGINQYTELRNDALFLSPKTVVFSCIERSILGLAPCEADAKIKYHFIQHNPIAKFIMPWIDRLYKAKSLHYLAARAQPLTHKGILSTHNKRFLYLQGHGAQIQPSEKNYQCAVKLITSYKTYFNSIGCRFIFLPIPNKETIYWEWLDLKEQPKFFQNLTALLKENGIETVDTLKLFNVLKEDGTMPYHMDDSHWNQAGVQSAAKALASMLNQAPDITLPAN